MRIDRRHGRTCGGAEQDEKIGVRHRPLRRRREDGRPDLEAGAAEHVSAAVAVPRDAITTRGGRRVALKVEAGAVHEVAVTEGLSNGSQVEISNGLKSGDVIIADARRDVATGTKVNPVFVKR